MALQQSFCLFVLATLYGVCQAQCVIRTLMPMTMVESCGMGCGMGMEESPSSTADDLSALLMLVRALEIDRAANANCGIDINGFCNTLIHALVYIATHNGGKGYGGYPSGQSQAAATAVAASSSSSSSSSGDSPNSNNNGLVGGKGGDGGSGGSGGSGKGDNGLLGGVGNTVDGLLGGLGGTLDKTLGGLGRVV